MKLSILLALSTAGLFTSGFAFASHKAWLLKNGGSECQFAVPAANRYVGVSGALYNADTTSNTANCPITLAGRWGSTGTGFAQTFTKFWADARSATIYVDRQGSAGVRTVSCNAIMQTFDGSRYYSATRSNTGDIGVGRIDLAGQPNGFGEWAQDANSTLEQNETLDAASLTFSCFLPTKTALLGVRARLCQFTQDCHDITSDPEDIEGGDGINGNYVQTSGIECSPLGTAGRSTWVRGYDGITNTSTAPQDVFCPIVPPADDSDESYRTVRLTKVRYSGGSTASNCVSAGTCPSCQLTWYGRDAAQHNFSTMPVDSAGTRTIMQPGLDLYNIGAEVQFGVTCRVPAATTIEGVTSLVTVTYIHGGQ